MVKRPRSKRIEGVLVVELGEDGVGRVGVCGRGREEENSVTRRVSDCNGQMRWKIEPAQSMASCW